MDIAYLLRRAAGFHPSNIAVDDGVTQRSFAALITRAERLANALDEIGVDPGAHVGILSSNSAASVEADVAIALGRRIRVALNARLHLEDFRFVAQDCELQALFFAQEFAPEAHALAEEFGLRIICLDQRADAALTTESLIETTTGETRARDNHPEATAWITYTSGTTGRPKGVMLSHRAIREVAFNLLLELGPVVPGEQIVLTQAVSHASGYFVLPYLLSGAGVRLMSSFDPGEVWKLSTRPDIRTLKAVPAMLTPLLDADNGTWGFETIVYGASSVPLPVLERSLERFGPTLVQDYGQSEAPMTLTFLSKLDHLDPVARLSAGRPWRTVAVEVRGDNQQILPAGEIGEVYVRGSHMMTGYHRKPVETSAALVDGWLRTKDLARTDDRGYVYLQGRADEMINSGGYNIAPREVEDILVTHDAVEEVVVLGLPDERWGESVTAVVRLRNNTDLTPDQLIGFVRGRLGMRTPKRVEIWDEIPRTSYGKVDRMKIRSALKEGSP